MLDRAVIFDMDGLLIDSEPLWWQAELEIFNDLGVPLQESMCHQTMGLRTSEVVNYWYKKFPWTEPNESAVAEKLISRVGELIMTVGQPMPGAVEVVQLCHQMQLPLALASSSSLYLIEIVLNKLGLQDTFNGINSGETEIYGKPHPAVYLTSAHRLGIHPTKCVAFEDSIRGIISAKAASMECIAVPAPAEGEDPRFAIADIKLDSLTQIDKSWLNQFLIGS